MPGPKRSSTFCTDINVYGAAIKIGRSKYGLVIIRATDVLPIRTPDVDLLSYAGEHGYVMVTGNFRDFPRTAQWLAQGKTHSGLILIRAGHIKNPGIIVKGLALYENADLTDQEFWV